MSAPVVRGRGRAKYGAPSRTPSPPLAEARETRDEPAKARTSPSPPVEAKSPSPPPASKPKRIKLVPAESKPKAAKNGLDAAASSPPRQASPLPSNDEEASPPRREKERRRDAHASERDRGKKRSRSKRQSKRAEAKDDDKKRRREERVREEDKKRRREDEKAKKRRRSPSRSRHRDRRKKERRRSRSKRSKRRRSVSVSVSSPSVSPPDDERARGGGAAAAAAARAAAARVSDKSTAAGEATRQELARRWADVSSSRNEQPLARTLQQTIQQRANLMLRKAQTNFSERAKAGKEMVDRLGPPSSLAAICTPDQMPGPLPVGLVCAGTAGPPGAASSASTACGAVSKAKPSAPAPNIRPVMVNPVTGTIVGSHQAGHQAASVTVGGSSSSSTPAAPKAGPTMHGAMLAAWNSNSLDMQRAWRAAFMPVNGNRPRQASQSFLRAMEADGEGGGSGQFATVDVDEGPEARQQRAAADKVAAEARRKRAQSVIARLPVEVLKEDAALDKCSVCLEPMSAGTGVRRLPCAHVFHADCIADWLQVSLTCPLDKLPVDDSIDMLSAARGPEAAAAASFAGSFPPPPANPPEGDASEPPGAPIDVEPAGDASPRPPSGPGPAPPTGLPAEEAEQNLPPVPLQRLVEAASEAHVPAELLADQVAQQRTRRIGMEQDPADDDANLLILE
eukprot:TRINITY_DN28291_c0_g1_i1.p1 TRINITY_DN28291_c0_g1~~TRINITY_DN28291_c0_g1_i1.p1  ORF type:complete len:680 (-),score=179.45 TRINITY_DN28291_c0_g1_i1:53-2092(-)